MMMDKILAFWNQFLQEKKMDPKTPYYESFYFERTEKGANELLRLVLKGIKKATASNLLSYEVEGERMPEVGDLSIVTDWYGNPHCVIETTRISLIPFKDMTYDICKREGEDENLESWRNNHLKFFKTEAEELGFTFTEDMIVVFEDFEVVYTNTFKEKNDQLMLVKPSKKHHNQIMGFRKEFIDYKESLHGGCGLHEFDDYDAWLQYLDKFENLKDLPSGRVLSSEYACIRKSDDVVVGMVNIRHYLNEELLLLSGHVGYSIRPTERQKGYAHEQLRLALLECDKLGINPILITCNKDNAGSRRTILKAGGMKENEVVEDDGNIVERYWIHRKQ